MEGIYMKKKHVAVLMSAVLAMNMAAVGYAANQTETGETQTEMGGVVVII